MDKVMIQFLQGSAVTQTMLLMMLGKLTIYFRIANLL